MHLQLKSMKSIFHSLCMQRTKKITELTRLNIVAPTWQNSPTCEKQVEIKGKVDR